MWSRCGYTSHRWTRLDGHVGALKSLFPNPRKPIDTPINGLQIRYASRFLKVTPCYDYPSEDIILVTVHD